MIAKPATLIVRIISQIISIVEDLMKTQNLKEILHIRTITNIVIIFRDQKVITLIIILVIATITIIMGRAIVNHMKTIGKVASHNKRDSVVILMSNLAF